MSCLLPADCCVVVCCSVFVVWCVCRLLSVERCLSVGVCVVCCLVVGVFAVWHVLCVD